MTKERLHSIVQESIDLLKGIIQIPSFSKKEDKVVAFLMTYLKKKKVKQIYKHKKNFWCYNHKFDKTKPSFFLITHCDTVRPSKSYTLPPFEPLIKNNKLYGLGSNDAGGSLVCMLHIFLEYYLQDLPFNLGLLICSEEEISGQNGISSVIDKIKNCDFTLIGEPTKMQAAICERNLLVVDIYIKGKSSHVGWNKGDNAILKAMEVIKKIQKIQLNTLSQYGIDSSIHITQIEAGKQHNIIPDECHLVLDIRLNEHYTPQDILKMLKKACPEAILSPRKIRDKHKIISSKHPLFLSIKKRKIPIIGSPTSSDMSLVPHPSIKIGVGDSKRSHTANEYILLTDIQKGIKVYHNIIETLKTFYL